MTPLPILGPTLLIRRQLIADPILGDDGSFGPDVLEAEDDHDVENGDEDEGNEETEEEGVNYKRLLSVHPTRRPEYVARNLLYFAEIRWNSITEQIHSYTFQAK
jgi:hypothetical protein